MLFHHATTTLRYGRQVSTLSLKGVIPALTTPFRPQDESIAFDQLKHNFERYNRIPFAGYLVQGSNGEFMHLTQAERVSLVENVKSLVPRSPGKFLMVGAGCATTRETIELSKKMAEAGADVLLVVTPSFYRGRMTNNALEKHYVAVADASSVPVVLYSVPANTNIDLDPEVIIRLAQHPNIIGMKDSGGDVTKLGYLVQETLGNNFQILAGSAGYYLPALTMGCVGTVCGLGNIMGDEVCRLKSLFESGQIAEAQRLQLSIIAVNWAVTKQFGVPGLKQAMDWLGFYGGSVRRPLQPLNDKEKAALRDIMSRTGLLQEAVSQNQRY